MCVSLQYAGINIGPVHKKDVMKASTMLEHDPQYVPLPPRRPSSCQTHQSTVFFFLLEYLHADTR